MKQEIFEVISMILKQFLKDCYKSFLYVFHFFWFKEEKAITVIREERLMWHEIMKEVLIWFLLLSLNFIFIIYLTNALSILTTIICLGFFLYWLRLKIVYSSKKHVINPDQEI